MSILKRRQCHTGYIWWTFALTFGAFLPFLDESSNHKLMYIHQPQSNINTAWFPDGNQSSNLDRGGSKIIQLQALKKLSNCNRCFCRQNEETKAKGALDIGHLFGSAFEAVIIFGNPYITELEIKISRNKSDKENLEFAQGKMGHLSRLDFQLSR